MNTRHSSTAGPKTRGWRCGHTVPQYSSVGLAEPGPQDKLNSLLRSLIWCPIFLYVFGDRVLLHRINWPQIFILLPQPLECCHYRYVQPFPSRCPVSLSNGQCEPGDDRALMVYVWVLFFKHRALPCSLVGFQLMIFCFTLSAGVEGMYLASNGSSVWIKLNFKVITCP